MKDKTNHRIKIALRKTKKDKRRVEKPLSVNLGKSRHTKHIVRNRW